ncbi:hypothetical protein [Kitasatospora sp. NPDC005856]|uniref:hypothetical protein n=1 Tax=Kitasatospora sp. NPDC005856 TaxID=3154566 RepID=UPI0033E1715A
MKERNGSGRRKRRDKPGESGKEIHLSLKVTVVVFNTSGNTPELHEDTPRRLAEQLSETNAESRGINSPGGLAQTSGTVKRLIAPDPDGEMTQERIDGINDLIRNSGKKRTIWNPEPEVETPGIPIDGTFTGLRVIR